MSKKLRDIDRRTAILDSKDELAKTLEPCPFCGGRMNEFPGVMVFDRKLISSDEYAVRCVNCSAMGAPAQSIEWAVANWNRRVEK